MRAGSNTAPAPDTGIVVDLYKITTAVITVFNRAGRYTGMTVDTLIPDNIDHLTKLSHDNPLSLFKSFYIFSGLAPVSILVSGKIFIH
jgi:hypothetical protein